MPHRTITGHDLSLYYARFSKRAELNRVLSYKSTYDVEGHNLCLALIRFKDGSTEVLPAYSNDSAIPESIRLGLNLIPDVYASLPKTERFGCNGMAQFHTEPKLLHFLCLTSIIRQSPFGGPLPQNSFYKSVLKKQREQAASRAQVLKRSSDLASVSLITEIDCCSTCTKYSIDLFRAKFPQMPLQVIELAKKVREKIPAQFKEATIAIK